MKKNLMVYMLASVLLGMVSLAHGRAAELKDPDAIALPQGITLEKMDKVVDHALGQKDWVKKKKISETPRAFEVEYAIRAHRIVMKIEYDVSTLQLSYVSSENLKYKKSKNKAYIHPNYIQWTQQLSDQIKSDLKLPENAFANESATNTVVSAGATSIPSTKLSSDVPKEVLSHFSKFKLEKTTINPKFNANSGNVQTGVNLDHSLNVTLTPKLDKWGKNDKTSRTLVIKPHIEAVRFIGGGARFFVGRMAGRSWIYVKVQLIDEISGDVIAEPEFYRIADAANGYTLARADYKMVEDAAADITSYLDNNYSTAIGGGIKPPQNIKSEL